MRVFLGIVMGVALLAVGCSKQPLTLDENTSMKALLRASDEEITELVMKEAAEKGLSAGDLSVKYILRDKNSQALAVKVSKK
jgi:hypothetical protein